MVNNFKNKNVIVTGGLGGLGYSIVNEFYKEGSNVGILDISKKISKNLNISDSKKKNVIKLYNCDLTNKDAVQSSVDAFTKDFGSIDILINNAGVLHSEPLIGFKRGKLVKHSTEMWDKVITLNITSVFYMSRCVSENMIKARTKGVIVNISSVVSSGNLGQSAYSASKASINSMTKVWAKELGPMGIRVFAISPGYISTPSTLKIMGEKSLNKVINNVPLKKLGRPDDIASFVVSCTKNNYVNGKVLEIDGGLKV